MTAERRAGRVGVWVVRPDKPPLPDGSPREDKIAAIGVRIRHWVSFHGISINVEPDLSHYAGIVPCGIAEHGVTSLVDLGLPVTLTDLDTALAETFEEVFGQKTVEVLQPTSACLTLRRLRRAVPRRARLRASSLRHPRARAWTRAPGSAGRA